MEPEKAWDSGLAPLWLSLEAQATHLSFSRSWFIQQESVRVGLKSVIRLGRAEGVPQVLGAGLGVGGRGGGDAAAPAPVPAGGAAAAVRHVAALLPGVAGRAGGWTGGDRGCSAPALLPHSPPRSGAGHSSSESGFPGFPGGSVLKNPPANAGDAGLKPGPGRPRRPVLWSLGAVMTKARAPWSLCPATGEAGSLQLQSGPRLPQLEKSLSSNKDPAQPKTDK